MNHDRHSQPSERPVRLTWSLLAWPLLLALWSPSWTACSSEAPAPPPAPTPAPADTPAQAAPAPTPGAPAAAPPPVGLGATVPGTVVLANYQGQGKYYAGVVTAVTGTQLSVLYADGDIEALGPDAVLPDRLTPPLPGEAFREGEYLPATIERRVGHALGVQFADGQRLWTSIALVRVAEANLSGPAYAPAAPAAFGQVGSVVLARYTGDGHWYEAVVGEILSEKRRVVYADGSSEDLTLPALRDERIAVGSRVETRTRQDPNWVPATVLLRAAHGVQVELASGERRWAAVGLVRVPPAQ